MFNKIILSILAFSIIPLSAQDEAKIEKDTIKTYQAPSLTVTSTRATKRESGVPFSEINQAEIKQRTSNVDLPQLMQTMPSIYSYSQNGNGIGYSILRLRGFDQRRISVLINGVPQNDPEDHNVYWINMSDIQESVAEIQVQRGAGLANYGSAAIAGSINLTTTAFINDPGVRVYSGAGYQEFGATNDFRANTNKFKFEYSSGMVDDKYAFYAKLGRIKSHGYRDQSFANLTSWFVSAVRFDDNLKSQINVYGGAQNDGLAYNGIPKSWTTDVDQRRANFSYWEYDSSGNNFVFGTPRRDVAVEEFSSPHYELLNDWYINDNLTLKSTLFYFEGKGYFDYSGTGWTSANSYGFDKNYPEAGDPGNPLIRAWVGNKQGGWVPRLIWEHGDGKLTTGAEVRIHRSNHWGKIQFAENLPQGYDPNYKFYGHDGERDILSFFAREQYKFDYLSREVTLSAETQVVYHSYRIDDDQVANEPTRYLRADGTRIGANNDIFNVEYLFINPRIGINMNYSDELNIYASAALTNREPRMKNLYDASATWYNPSATPNFRRVKLNDSTYGYDFSNPLVKPEKMFNIEAGMEYITNKYNFGVNFYLMDYRDELVKSGQLDQFGAPIDGNAENTMHYGVELVAGANIFDNSNGKLDLYANATISRNEIIEYNYVIDDETTVSLEGNRIAGFPNEMGAARINYSYGNLSILLSGNYLGSFKTDNFGSLLTNDPRIKDELGSGYYTDNTVDSYYFFNANIAYNLRNILGTQNLRVHLQVNNITNNLYAASGEGREFFPGPERNAFLGVELEF